MKRIASFVLCAVMILSCLTVQASPQTDLITYLTNSQTADDENSYATRDYMAYVTAKLLKSGDKPAVITRYNDVGEDNIYSGYIKFLTELNIINGTGDGNFMPKGDVNAQSAYKMALSVIGFAKLVEYYNGDYAVAASSLGITTSVKEPERLTKEEMLNIFYNAVLCPMPETEYLQTHEEIKEVVSEKRGYSYISSRLNLNVVTGKLISKTKLYVTKSDKGNVDYITENTEISVSINPTLDIAHFLYVPSTILINKDGEVVYIKEKKSVSVEYRSIYAVNGDSEEGKAYAANYIKNIEFANDEEDYDVSEDILVRYNGEITERPCELTGKVAKIVSENGEIIFIESYAFERAGLITSVSSDEISYIKNNDVYFVKELYNYEDIVIYIDSRSGVLGDLKAGSVFEYYTDGKILCISASERTASDKLNSVSSDKITVGNISFKTDSECVYLSEGKWQSAYSELLGAYVQCNFAPNGKIAFVQRDKSEDASINSFYGFVSGVKEIPMEETECEIEVYNLSANCEKQIYKITKNTAKNGITVEELKLAEKKSDGTGLFFFKSRKDGIISELNYAEEFYGYEGERQCALSFVDSVAMSTSNGNTLYFKDVPITAIYESDNEYNIKQVDWSSLQGRYCGSQAYMRFYGRDKCFIPEVAVLYGELSSIGSKARKYGVVTGKNYVLDSNGEKAVELSVLVGMSKMKYTISEETAKDVPQKAFITFYDELLFSPYDITLVAESIDMTGRTSTWEKSFYSGTVEKISEEMIYLSDGRVSCLHPNQNFFIEYSDGNPANAFKGITVADIHEGDKVYCNYLSDGIRGIIVEGD